MLIMPHMWAREDASPCCSLMWICESIYWWCSLPCTNTWKRSISECKISSDPSSPMPLMTFSKVKASALWIIYSGHYVSLLLIWDYDYDAYVSRVWDGRHTHHIIPIHMSYALPLDNVLKQWRRHVTSDYLQKPYIWVNIWASWDMKMRARDEKVWHCFQTMMRWQCLTLL